MSATLVRVIRVRVLGLGILALGCGEAISAATPEQTSVALSGDAAGVTPLAQSVEGPTGTLDFVFGHDVAIWKHTVVVGAGEAAHVLRRGASGWAIQAPLLPADAGSKQFGASVSVSESTIAVGAPADSAAGTQSGSVYVFTEGSGSWSQQAKLVPTDGVEWDRFGHSVGVAGDVIAIGTPQSGPSNLGAVYLFTRSGTTWVQQQKLVPPDGASLGSAMFGQSLSFSGSRLAIGAINGSPSGAVYVYSKVEAGWVLEAKLTPANGVHGDQFGESVVLDGDTLAGGAHLDDQQGVDAGAAYVFERGPTGWVQRQKLIPGAATGDQRFGMRVALTPNLLAVGAPKGNTAYVFEPGGGHWWESAKLSEGAAVGAFGISMAANEETLVIGAQWGGSKHQGAVYLYDVRSGQGASCKNPSACASGFCVDGVCCDGACGGGDQWDCQACAKAAGAASDGACTPTTGIPCNDGSACTQTDTCQAGSCTGANPVACAQLDQCHDPGTCDPLTGACSNPQKLDGTACNDGSACTQTDTCQAGSCTGANPVACAQLDQCHDPGTCDPLTGACSNPQKLDGTACDGGACSAGTCVPDSPGSPGGPFADGGPPGPGGPFADGGPPGKPGGPWGSPGPRAQPKVNSLEDVPGEEPRWIEPNGGARSSTGCSVLSAPECGRNWIANAVGFAATALLARRRRRPARGHR